MKTKKITVTLALSLTLFSISAFASDSYNFYFPRKDTSPNLATVAAPEESTPVFRFGLSALFWQIRSSDERFPKSSGGPFATLGYDFSDSLAVNVFGGMAESKLDTLAVGTELQVTPFYLDNGRRKILELGFLLGVSTLSQNRLDALMNPSQIHIGGRFTMNLNRYVALSGATRLSANFLTGDAGLVVRL